MKDTTHQAAAKRLRKKGLNRDLTHQREATAKTTLAKVQKGGPVSFQKGSYPTLPNLKRGK